MRITRSFLVLCLMFAAPASAQIVGRPHYGPVARPSPFLGDSSGPRVGVGRDLRDARRDIDADRRAGRITRAEARALKREAGLIATLAERYGRNGLSISEADELETRAAALRQRTGRR